MLAATHVDLQQAIAQRRFREDLYYRLSVFPLRLPPLRERLEDLPQLCAFLLEEQARRTGRRGMRVTPEGLERLAAYDWPGNLRELANVLERATILSRAPELGAGAFDLPVREKALPAAAPAPAAKTREASRWPRSRRCSASTSSECSRSPRAASTGPAAPRQLLGSSRPRCRAG